MLAEAGAIPADSITVIACVGIAVGTTEELLMRSMFADIGLLSWPVLRVTRQRVRVRLLRMGADRVFGAPGFSVFLLVKLTTALCLATLVVSGVGTGLVVAVLTFALLAQVLLMKARTAYGLDGSDHMYVVILLGLAVARAMPPDSFASRVGIYYIGAQAVLSYAIAGIAKLFGTSWRNGSAIGGIMSTVIYGNLTAAEVLRGRSWLGHVVCWSVMAFEIIFAAVLVVRPPLMWCILGVGLIFHLSTALLMGLNSFLLAFVSTYPAIVYAHDALSAGSPWYR